MDFQRLLKIPSQLGRLRELPKAFTESKSAIKALTAYVGLSRLEYPITIDTRSFGSYVIYNKYDLAIFWLILFRRDYLVQKDFKTILDLGAHAGIFSVFAAHVAPDAKIIAFEPHPTSFARLQTNISRNGLAGRVQCQKRAIACASGIRRMTNNPDVPHLQRLLGESEAASAIKVEAITLPEILRQNSENFDLLKIDVEGSEYEILPGLSRAELRRFRYICMEYHPFGNKSYLFSIVIKAGFKKIHEAATNDPGSGIVLFKRLS